MIGKLLIFFVVLFSIISCTKDLVGPQYPESTTKNPGSQGIWILNEGGFGWGNASISFYDTQRKQMSNRVFSNKQNAPLGDVLQSMFAIDNERYLVVNYSNYIKVCTPEMDLIETIEPIISPRYISQLNDSNVLITSFESEKIIKHNRYSKQTSLFAQVPEWTEKIYRLSDHIYVEQKSRLNQNPQNQNILKLDFYGNFVDTLKIAQDHSELLKISESKFAFISHTSSDSKLWISDTSFSSKAISTPEKISQITYSNNTIYLSGKSLWSFNLDQEVFEEITFLNDRNIYGLNSSEDGYLYLSDATKDYTSAGNFLIYALESKQFIDSVKTSYIPSEIYFEQ